MSIREKMQKRAELLARCREIIDAADREKRSFSDEENTNYNKAFADAAALKAEIDRDETLEREERSASESRGTYTGGNRETEAPDQHRAAFMKWFTEGDATQLRALQVDQDSKGGYLVPRAMAQSIIQEVDNLVFMRRLATVQSIPTAVSLGYPYLTTDVDDADWTSELGTGNEGDVTFGKRELKPSPLAKRIKISNTLLRQASNVEAFAQSRLAYKFGVAQEKGFLTGTGSGQPLGVFTASNDGIPTTRDVSSGNTATAIKMDGLYNAKYALKSQYWPRAQWVFHRDAVAQIAKLKDGEGRYLWTESTRVGEPDRLLGFPVNMSEYAPNTFTSALYVGLLGDFSQYYIADSLSLSIQRLVELYATTNQTGYIARLETDGMPVLAEAFSRVKLG